MAYIGNTATTQAFTPAVDFFNGDNSTVAFTLSRPVASVAQVQAVVENVPQKPGDAYTVSGNTITFTSAPPSGTQNIYVYYTSPITQVIAPGQGTVGTAQIQNGAVIPADLSTGAPVWDTSGNVGIGTSTPDSLTNFKFLDVGSSSTNQGVVQANNGTVKVAIYANGSNGFVATRTNHNLNFQTNGTTRATIDTSGNLLVGTTTASPGNGNNTIGTAVQGATGFYGCREPANYCVYLNSTVLDGSNRANYISFGLYGTTNIGAIHANGLSTVYATSSDYRLKENVTPLSDSLDKVMQLKPCKWKWKDLDSETDGFIAHELAEVCPNAVSGEKDAVDEDGKPVYQSVDTSFLVATLTAAIQEQQAIIESLTQRITALEAK